MTTCVHFTQTPLAGSVYYTYGIYLNVAQGAADFVGGSADTEGPNTVTTVDGYQVTVTSDRRSNTCFAVVDTGDGQNMSVQTTAAGEADLQQLCDLTVPVAQIAMDALAQLQL